jgi:hypothetical protein
MSVISTADDISGVVQTFTAAARAPTIDPRPRHILTPTAEFEVPREDEKTRPAMKPGTFGPHAGKSSACAAKR